MAAPRPLTPKDFSRIYRLFSAPVSSRYDCGKFCAPLNGGSALCCSTSHTVPVARRAEWALLKSRTDLWRPFRAYDANTRKIKEELDDDCIAIACKGARFCERDNRTLACRAFPYFPYFTRERELVGIAFYWDFADRCWLISNPQVVEKKFIGELIAGYKHLFILDPEEEDVFVDHSAEMRRVFSRKNKPIPILAADGRAFIIPPKSGGKLKPAKRSQFAVHKNFKSQKAYLAAIKDEGGDVNTAPNLPKRG